MPYIPGTWIDTAKNYRSYDSILYSDLQAENGDWSTTWTYIWKGASYENVNGKFVITPPLPGGNWKLTARDYKVADNTTLSATLQTFDPSKWVTSEITILPFATYTNENGAFEAIIPSGNVDIPGGSWRLTAKNCTVASGVLYAQLQDKPGHYVWAWTWVWRGATYENVNGKFSIIEAPLPDGDWKETAKDWKVDGTTLTALLQKMDHTWVEASIEIFPYESYQNADGEFWWDGNQPLLESGCCISKITACLHSQISHWFQTLQEELELIFKGICGNCGKLA